MYLYVFLPHIPNVFVSCQHVFPLWQGMSYDVDPCDISNVIQVKVAITPQSPSNQKYLEFEHFVSTEYLNLSVEGNRIWHQRILLQNNHCIFQYIICTFWWNVCICQMNSCICGKEVTKELTCLYSSFPLKYNCNTIGETKIQNTNTRNVERRKTNIGRRKNITRRRIWTVNTNAKNIRRI